MGPSPARWPPRAVKAAASSARANTPPPAARIDLMTENVLRTVCCGKIEKSQSAHPSCVVHQRHSSSEHSATPKKEPHAWRAEFEGRRARRFANCQVDARRSWSRFPPFLKFGGKKEKTLAPSRLAKSIRVKVSPTTRCFFLESSATTSCAHAKQHRASARVSDPSKTLRFQPHILEYLRELRAV